MSLENTTDVDYRSNYAKALLAEIESVPEFRSGISNLSTIEKHKQLIQNLLPTYFRLH
jgi:hypothetical protein